LGADMSDPHLVAVADARFLLRRAFRIIDDEARRSGLDPLANQLLVQLRGAPEMTHSVSELAMRLDVPLNLVSRLAGTLERQGYVERLSSTRDRRVTLVRATDAGAGLAGEIGERSRERFTSLKDVLSEDRRVAALQVWVGNFGIEMPCQPAATTKGAAEGAARETAKNAD
jgi:DNA-binding MarR family transcriptional regulator